MIFKDVEKKYVKAALDIALEEYRAECLRCSQLIEADFEEELSILLTQLFENSLGKVAIEEGKVVGYMAFEGPWEGFHGKAKGVFSPLGGSGFSGSKREMLASRLFEAVSQSLANKGVCSYALSRYAHDEEVGKSFVFNGFGIRCSDAMMRLKDRKNILAEDLPIKYVELVGKEKEAIDQLERGLTQHLVKAPTFFPTKLEYYNQCIKNNDIRVFVAKDGNDVVGFIAIDQDAENYITEHKEMYSICGMFVKEAYRGRKIADQLVEHVSRVAEKEGMSYLGVDCETLNPTALRFWSKYFEPYTYSYHRRIDERVIGYQAYMDHFFDR